jgi:hypothetical protein
MQSELVRNTPTMTAKHETNNKSQMKWALYLPELLVSTLVGRLVEARSPLKYIYSINYTTTTTLNKFASDYKLCDSKNTRTLRLGLYVVIANDNYSTTLNQMWTEL